MWTEVEHIIERLVRGQDLGVVRVNEILDADLRLTLDTPLTRRYKATISAGPFREVELRVIPETGLSFLALRANPDHPIVTSADDLRGFGAPKWTALEPNASPEGKVSECYALPGMELRVGYRAKSRRLEAVALEQKSPRTDS